MARPFYVTTPIYYVNDVPHIGHAYTTVAADTLARYRRLLGDDVVFLTGTDEHGLKVQQAAEAHGVTPQEWADGTSVRFRECWDLLDITNTDFIRTTEPRHRIAVQEFLQRVYDNGHIELDVYEGLYCVPCEAYYTEDELLDGNCPEHGRPVERVREENYFFRLSRFEQQLLDFFAAHPDAVQPESRRNEVLGFIKQGLRDFVAAIVDFAGSVGAPAILGSMQGRWEVGVSREQAVAWLAEALEQLGHEVVRFAWHRYFDRADGVLDPAFHIARRLQNKFVSGPTIRRLNADLTRLATAARPDATSPRSRSRRRGTRHAYQQPTRSVELEQIHCGVRSGLPGAHSALGNADSIR